MPPWLIDAIKCKCPNCHKGDLFAGVLKLRDECANCGMSFKDAETADGPAFFVMTIVGFIVTPLLFLFTMGLKMSPLLAFLLLVPITLGLCIGLLRPFKAGIYAIQKYKNFKEAKAKDYEHLQK